MENETLIKLLKEIQANQQSLHEDMTVVVDRLKKLEGEVTTLIERSDEPAAINEHELYLAARALVVETGRASTSLLQRVLRIPYTPATHLMNKLEENHVIGPKLDGLDREVLLDRETLSDMEEQDEIESVHSS